VAVSLIGAYARSTVTPAGATAPLFLPPGWQPGDKAIIRVTVPTNITFVNFFGWSKIHDQVVTGARRVGVFQKVLVAGDGDGTMTFSNVCAFTMEAVGVRSWDSTYTLVPSTAGSSTAASNIVAPSVATGYGVLLCYHTKQQSNDAGSGLNTWTPAAGMTILQIHSASSASGGSITAGPVTMFEWEPRVSGASGTRSATSLNSGTALYPGAWTATSIFVRGLADTVIPLGLIHETNTVKAATLAYGPTTIRLGLIHETNTPKPVKNPLLSVWTTSPQVLKEVPVTGSVVVWDATVPTGSSLVVETSVDNGASFQPATQAKPVPGLVNGLAVAKTVLARITMRKELLSSPTPVFRRLEFRVDLDASRDEVLPLGVFTLNDTEIIDTFDGVALELSGSDRSRSVSRNSWEKTYPIWTGTNVGTAIMQIIRDRRPGTPFNFVSTDKVLPGVFLGQDSSIDPMQDAQKFARDAGMEVYFDPYGTCVMRPEPDPDVQASVWTFEDVYNPTIISLSRRVTDEDTYNRVVVIGEGSGLDAPVRGIWENLDPADPTYILGNYREVTQVVRSSNILNSLQAYEAARAMGLRLKGATEILEADVIPNYALEQGDIVTVQRGKSGVEGLWILDAIKYPLGPEDLMHISARRQRLS
jgi:hypothetical protein